MEAIGKSFEPPLRDFRNGAVDHVAKEGGPNVAIEKAVVESVLEASKTAVARLVAVDWTTREEIQRLGVQLQTEFPGPPREARPTRQRVVDVDLRPESRRPEIAERWPELRL